MIRITTTAVLAALALLAAGLAPGRAGGQSAAPRALASGPSVVVQSTGFEAGSFNAGEVLDGQSDWIAMAGRDAMLVSDEGAHHGHQCVTILGDLLDHTHGMALEAFAGRYILYDAVAEGTPVVHLRASARLDGPDTGEGPKEADVSANFYTATTAGENLGAFYVASDGYVYASAGGGPYFLYRQPYQLGTYVDLDLVLNFDTRTTTFLVNGASMGSAPMYPEPLTTTSIIAAPFELNLSHNRVKAADRHLFTAYFDDYSVTAGTE